MKRDKELKRHLSSLQTLQQAVGAMKSLSAHHFRETRAGLEPLRAYRDGLHAIAGEVGASLPAGDGPAGLLVIGSELGLCGAYNSDLARAAARRRTELGEGPTWCVGRRAANRLSRSGVEIARTYSAPTSVARSSDLLLELAEALLEAFVRLRLGSLEATVSRFRGVGAAQPTTIRILPIEEVAHDGTPAVVRYVGAERLQAVIVRELLYVTMVELFHEALTSEHGARLEATRSAESWLSKRTEELRRSLAAARREASTQEVLEVAAGAEAFATRSR